MKILISFLLFFIPFLLPAQVQFFEGSWPEAKAEAIKAGKLLFVDVYTTWCGPCRMMEKNTFPDPELGRIMNHFFVNYRMNAEGQWADVAKSYHADKFPTYLFLNSDGSLFESAFGYMDSVVFRIIVRKAVANALTTQTTKQTFGLTLTTGVAMLAQEEKQGNDITLLLEELLRNLPKDSLNLPLAEKTVIKYTSHLNGLAFNYLCQRAATSKRCTNKINRLLEIHCAEAIRTKNEKALKTILSAAELAFGEDSDKTLLKKGQLQSQFYLETQKVSDFIRFTKKFVPKQVLPALQKRENAFFSDWQIFLDNIIWQYSEYVKDVRDLNEVLDWAEVGITVDASTQRYEAAAQLALLAGQKDRAKAWLEKGIVYAKAHNDTYSSLEKLLNAAQ